MSKIDARPLGGPPKASKSEGRSCCIMLRRGDKGVELNLINSKLEPIDDWALQAPLKKINKQVRDILAHCSTSNFDPDDFFLLKLSGSHISLIRTLAEMGNHLLNMLVPKGKKGIFLKTIKASSGGGIINAYDFAINIPWELLHSGENLDDVKEFLGYSKIFCRRPKPGSAKGNKNNPDLVGVGFVADSRLKEVVDLEREIFQKLNTSVKDSTHLSSSGARGIEIAKFNKFIQSISDILHFCCHGGDDGSIIVNNSFEITQQDIEEDILFFKEAFVALNCCSAGAVVAIDNDSTAKLCIKKGAQTVVGPYSDISSLFALQFASKFYEHLLVHKKTVSDAILASRREIIDDTGNPSGLFYGVYGSPEHSIKRKGE